MTLRETVTAEVHAEVARRLDHDRAAIPADVRYLAVGGFRSAVDMVVAIIEDRGYLRPLIESATETPAGHVAAVHKVNLPTENNLTVYVDELFADETDAQAVAVELAERLGLPLDDTDGLVSTNYQPRKVR